MRSLICIVLLVFICGKVEAQDKNLKPERADSIALVKEKVPERVMKKFTKSFRYDPNGKIQGANVAMLKPFLSTSETLILLKSYIPGSDKAEIIQGYEPKGRGLKRNSKWMGVVYDTVHQ